MYVLGVSSFSLLCCIPSDDYITAHLYILLLIDFFFLSFFFFLLSKIMLNVDIKVLKRMFWWMYIHMSMGFTGGSVGKNSPANARDPEMQVWSLHEEDHLKKEIATHSSILAGKSREQRSLVGYSPWGCKESHTTVWLSKHTHIHTHTCFHWRCNFDWNYWVWTVCPFIIILKIRV